MEEKTRDLKHMALHEVKIQLKSNESSRRKRNMFECPTKCESHSGAGIPNRFVYMR